MALADCLLMIVAAFMVYASLLSAGNMVAALGLMDVAMEQVEALDNTPRMDFNGKEISVKIQILLSLMFPFPMTRAKPYNIYRSVFHPKVLQRL